jgi:hypothetical protein
VAAAELATASLAATAGVVRASLTATEDAAALLVASLIAAEDTAALLAALDTACAALDTASAALEAATREELAAAVLAEAWVCIVLAGGAAMEPS